MKKRRWFGLASAAVLLTVVLIGTLNLLRSQSIHLAAVPTKMVLPTVEGAAVQFPVAEESMPPVQAVPVAQADSLATELPPLPTDETSLVAVPQQSVANQVVIRFEPSASPEERAAYVKSFGGTVQQEIDALDTLVVSVPAETADNDWPTSPLVADSEPDYYVTALIDVPTSDAYYPDQWALPVIGAPEAWSSLPVDAPVVAVAVIDSGVCLEHPDLAGKILPGYDFVQDDTTPQDDFGHGCGVAGIIAANIDNGLGMAGVAPNARIMPLRVLDAAGIGTYSDVAAAIVWAADHGAQIINLSLGGTNTSTLLQNAIDYALARDVTVIAAAGNTGQEGVLYPAAYAPVIAVGSVDPDLERSSFSTYGPEMDLLAPGSAILTTSGSSYASASGTSFAAPHVAGIAAIEIALGESLMLDGGVVTVSVSSEPPTDEAVVALETPLNTPTGLIARTTSATTIRLYWTDNATDETAFHIERSLDGSTGWGEVGTVGANVLTYNDSDLTVYTDYFYRVRAYRSGDDVYSGYSDTASTVTSTISRVSIGFDGAQANGDEGLVSISADGRYVAFGSHATNLVPNDTNNRGDIFVHDRQTGQVELVSVASDGTQANAHCHHPVISGDGRYVAFYTAATNLIPGGTNGQDNIFVHDRLTNETTLISVAFDGTQSNHLSWWPTISNDGRYVAFWSYASNLVDSGCSNDADIYVHDRQTGETTCVSKAFDGSPGNESSLQPDISGDGRYVAFYSWASNLVPDDTNGVTDIFVHDRQTGETTRVSVASDGSQGGEHSFTPRISEHGRFITFASASTLTPGDTNGDADIFVHDRLTGQTNRVSISSSGILGNGQSLEPGAISYDGRFIAFRSEASNLVDSDNNNEDDVFLHDRQTGETSLLSHTLDGSAPNDFSYGPSISADARFIAFNSFASDLVSDDTNGQQDGFIAEIWPYVPTEMVIAPSGLVADTVTDTQIDLSWEDNAWDETAYHIERSPDGSNWTEIDTVPFNETTYTDSALACGTTYHYRVRGYRSDFDTFSAYSNTISATTLLCTPTGLSAIGISQTGIDLTWTDNETTEAAYLIERSPDGSTNWVEIDAVGADSTSYSDSELTCDTPYYYRVQAFRSSDVHYSAYSDIANGATWFCAGAAPSDLTAAAVAETQINLSWTDNTATETAFHIERSPDGTNWVEIDTVEANTVAYTDSELDCETPYTYRVRALSGNGLYSVYSDTANATTATCPPEVTPDPSSFCYTTNIPASECEALAALYASTDGDNWTNTTGWLTDTQVQYWHGVIVNVDGHVDSVDLHDNALTGSIPPELGNLPSLDMLNLNSNQLTGSIPAALANLSNLERLDLGFNQLSGNIPPELGSLNTLTSLNLFSNQLTGGIPPELGNLSNLTWLLLTDNPLGGSIPPELGNLSNLTWLDMGMNQLTGSIPPQLGNLTLMWNLTLADNQLTGSIPVELGNLPNLAALILDVNQLNGSIPPELGNLSQLDYLGLSNNQLTGSIPSALGGLVNLRELYLSNNHLDGAIPSEIGNLTNLETLVLHNNALSGEVPATITNLVNLDTVDNFDYPWAGDGEVDLGYNALVASGATATFLDGKDPNWADTQTIAPSNLQVDSVTSNSVPLSWTAIPYTGDGGYYEVYYKALPAGSYTLHGTTADKSTTGYTATGLVSGVEYAFQVRTFTPTHGDQQNDLYSAYSAEVTGTTTEVSFCAGVTEIPEIECEALKALYLSTDGDNWSNNTGWLVDTTVSNWWGVAVTDGHVTGIYPSNQNLNGTLPAELGNLTHLQSLMLAFNSELDGSIPPELGNLTNLGRLRLNYNNLSGSIPPQLGNLPNLWELELSGNSLGGGIPSELGNLTNLQWLYLRNNELGGGIPPVLSNLTNLRTLDLSDNNLGGSIPPELGDLANLQYLYLINDQLSGSIPPELGDLANLRSLRLNHNQLSGSIPPQLGDFTHLTGLYLNNNQLSGSIPPQLGNLSNLDYLHLDNNRLSGSIPPELGGLTSVWSVYLYSNQLSGSIPPELGNLTNVTSLDLYNNQLSGSIPPELGDLTNLTSLSLYLNQLSGSIPPELGDLPNVTSVNLSKNQLSGSIPPELGDLTNLHALYLQYNALQGEVPASISNLVNLSQGATNLGYNALYASGETATFLDSKDPDWANTQTVAPTHFQITSVLSDRVTLSWTPSLYGGYYVVYTRELPDGEWPTVGAAITPISASGYTVTGLTSGVNYAFRAQVITGQHDEQQNDLYSDYTNEVTSGILPTTGALPNAPTGLTPDSVSQTQIDLSWTDNSTDETAFHIEWSPDGVIAWVEIATVGADVTTFSDSGLSCGTEHHYRVRAYRAGDGQYSPYSNAVDVLTSSCPSFNAPTNLTATTLSTSQLGLSWIDNSDNETAFHIERSPDGSTDWAEIDTVGADMTTYQDTNLTCETTYYYRVRAYQDGTGYTDFSNTANATTVSCTLPTNTPGPSPTSTVTPTPTRTPITPTATWTWVPTATMTATVTPDVTEFSCANLHFDSPAFFENRFYIDIINDNEQATELTRTYVVWNDGLVDYPDMALSAQALDSEIFWTGGDTSSPTDTDNSGDGTFISTSDRTVNGQGSAIWELAFTDSPQLNLYITAADFNGTTFYFDHPTEATDCALAFNVPEPLVAPSALSAEALTESMIGLHWTDNSADETTFHIERSLDGSTNWTEVGTKIANIGAYVNTGLSPTTTYFYRVRAYRSSDNSYSVYSNTASATTLAALQPGPVFTVMTTEDTGDTMCRVDRCTLRGAINTANVNPGADTIVFNIPGGGPYTIRPESALPQVTGPVTIDGWSQPGFAGVPIIEINGFHVGMSTDGLRISGGDSTVRGLVINDFSGNGINLLTNGNNTIIGNYIGTDVTGTIEWGNGNGIIITSGEANIIGGVTPQERNLISGNDNYGVHVYSPNNMIQGNYIGTDVTGTLAIGNYRGVRVDGGNLVGGSMPGMGNVISGNDREGVDVGDGEECTIQGNFIGTDVTGTQSLGNASYGIVGYTSSNMLIVDNVISANSVGISASSGGIIQSNKIGTDITGTVPMGNATFGIYVYGSDNTIGGANPGEGNIIAHNGTDGISIYLGNHNAILGNSIFSNGELGIELVGMTGNDVGDGDSGVNDLQNYPVLTEVTANVYDYTVDGTLNSIADSTYRIELFDNTTCDGSGYGEGETYLGFVDATTDASGNASFSTPVLAVTQNHFITATATDANGNTSAFSQCIQVNVPNAPSGLMITNLEPTSITLHWVDNSNTETAFHIERSTDGSNWMEIDTVGANVTVYADANLSCETSYYYRVRAYQDGSGYSTYSNIVSATTATCAPSPFCATVTDVPAIECGVLEALYTSTDGDNWYFNTGWLTDTTVNNWYGVTVSGGHVTELRLSGDNLSGNIPVELSNLNHLQILYLYDNQLTSVPSELGDITSLQLLYLGDNPLTSIPATLGNLTNLLVLYLGNTELTSVPSELGDLINLKSLILTNTGLTSVPSELGDLTSLERLYLDDNQLTSIPSELGNLTSLQRLYLDNNQLTSVPAELGNLANLEILTISKNQLSGSIPSELGNLTNLTWLILSANQLDGNIPPELGNLINLWWLDLSGNQLSGSIPAELGNLTNLNMLHLENNALEGEIPTSITNLINLRGPDSDPYYLQYMTDFGYNALYSTNPAVIAFLNSKDADWADTQTIAPSGVQVDSMTADSVTLSWTAIPYTADNGYYEVYYKELPVGSYTPHGTTADKTTTSYTVTGLVSGVEYAFQVRTFTPAHVDQQNDLTSDFSPAVTALIPYPPLTAPVQNPPTGVTRNGAELAWTDTVPGQMTTFHIERAQEVAGATGVGALAVSPWQQVAVIPGGLTTFAEHNLACGTTYYYRIRGYRDEDGAYSPYSDTQTLTTQDCPPAITNTIGLYKNGVWQFRNSNATGPADLRFAFGPRESGWTAVVGDWNGDGTDGIGVYKDGVWYLRYSSDGGEREISFHFNPLGTSAVPLVGDWDGDNVDTIGVYKDGVWLLRNSLSDGAPDVVFHFGLAEADWLPVVGDWNGGGADRVGLYRNGVWYLHDSLTSVDRVRGFTFGPMKPGWLPIIGDWNQDGVDTIGLYKDGIWRLRNSNNEGTIDVGINFIPGETGWLPVASYRGGVSGLQALGLSTVWSPVVETETPNTPTNTPFVEPTVAPESTEAVNPTEEITDEPLVTDVPESTIEALPSVTATPVETAVVEPSPTETETPIPTATELPPTATPLPTETPVPPNLEPEPPETTQETGN